MQITIREPGSAITHFIGMMMAIIAATPLMVKAAVDADHIVFIALAVFIGSMIALYGASALYHSVTVKDSILKVFRKLDHMMIFVLIAGSYTPVCLISLGGKTGYTLLTVVWGIAAAGICFFPQSGASQSRGCLSNYAGSPVLNGFHRSFTSLWAGHVSPFSARSGAPSQEAPFYGFSRAAFSTRRAVSSTR